VQRLAQTTGGACEFIAPNEDAEAGILRMFARLRAPRIARADVTWPIAPRWTTPLPQALFGGETVHVFAGFDTAPASSATLQLRAATDGAVLAASAALPTRVGDDPTVARMAAATRIAGGDEATQLALALQYSLLTERTNFLVVHERAEGEKAQDLPALAKVAQMHAAGWGGVGSVSPKVSAVYCLSVPHLDVDFADFEDHITSGSDAKLAPDASAEADRIDGFLFMLDEGIAGAGRVVLPTTLTELVEAGAWSALLAAVEVLMREGFAEVDAIAAILEALAPRAATLGLSRQLVRELRHALRGGAEHARLRRGAAEAVERLAANRSESPASAF